MVFECANCRARICEDLSPMSLSSIWKDHMNESGIIVSWSSGTSRHLYYRQLINIFYSFFVSNENNIPSWQISPLCKCGGGDKNSKRSLFSTFEGNLNIR